MDEVDRIKPQQNTRRLERYTHLLGYSIKIGKNKKSRGYLTKDLEHFYLWCPVRLVAFTAIKWRNYNGNFLMSGTEIRNINIYLFFSNVKLGYFNP